MTDQKILLFFSDDIILCLFILETAGNMVVYNTGGPHGEIHNYAAQKPDRPLFHVRRGFARRFRSDQLFLKAFPFSGYVFTIRKTPDIGRKTAGLL
jgi:hypothetical protein